MITITITSDESLTSLKFDKLLYECTQLGVEVCIRAEFNVAPAQRSGKVDAGVAHICSVHTWPDLNDSNSSNSSAVKDFLTVDPFAVDWPQLDPKHNWHAFDRSGVGHSFKTKPVPLQAEWVCGNCNDWEGSGAMKLPNLESWQESLRERPPVIASITTSSLLKDQAS